MPRQYDWNATTTTTSPSKTPPAKREVERLSNTLDKQRAKFEWATDEPAEGKPSLFSNVTGRIFDTLSRGQYMVMEPLARAAEHLGDKTPESRKGKNPFTDILGGFVGGAAGKHKTSMSDTLLRAAEADPDSLTSKALRENKLNIRSGLGLVGDIALDPTTYMGAGIVKSVGKETVKAVGGKAAQDILQQSAKKVVPKADINKAVSEAIKKKGSKLTPAERDEVVESLKGVKASEAAEAAESAARQAGKGKVEFKFAGQKIGESERLFQAGQKVGNKLGGTELGQNIAKKLRPTATFVGKTNVFKRRFENEGVAVYEDVVKKMRNGQDEVIDPVTGQMTSPKRLGFKDLTKAEKKDVARAIETGTPLTRKAEKTGLDLQDYVDEAKFHFDEIFASEVQMGLRQATDAMPNYLYHYYRKGKDKPEFSAFKQKRAGKTPVSLDEARAAGLDPVEDIDDIIALRYADHYNVKSQKSFIDAVTKEYGAIAKTANDEKVYAGRGLQKVDHPHMPDGVFLPPEVASTIKHIKSLHDRPEMAGAFLKHFDRVQAAWKTGATVINPGHHVRNLIGDTYMNYLDGVVNINRYKQAGRLLRNKNNAEAIEKMTFKVGGQNVRGDQIHNLYERFGAKSGFYRTEYGEGKLGLEALRKFSEGREDFGRMAHFLDSLIKEGKGAKNWSDVEKAADAAAQRVRKWNIDYGDLTDWERKYGKRAIPFYTWMRKNMPLQIEALALRPGRIAAIPKGQRAMEQVLGTHDPEGSSIGEIIPQYIKEMSPIRLRGEGESKNAWYWGVPLPFMDVGRMTEGGPKGTLKNILSSTTPIARVPTEIAFGQNLFTGQKIKSVPEYLMQQLPLARQGMAIQGGTQDPMSARMLNYLTGLGIHSISESQQLGELRRQQDPVQQKQRELNQKLRKEYLGG